MKRPRSHWESRAVAVAIPIKNEEDELGHVDKGQPQQC